MAAANEEERLKGITVEVRCSANFLFNPFFWLCRAWLFDCIAPGFAAFYRCFRINSLALTNEEEIKGVAVEARCSAHCLLSPFVWLCRAWLFYRT